VEGNLFHLWHGKSVHRGYRERNEGLARFRFDPSTDIAINQNGVWRWNSDKSEMYEFVRNYFASRLPQHPFGDDLNVEELFDDETLVVVGMESPWARRRKIDLADLAAEEWILPPAYTTNSLVVMEAFLARGLEPPKVKFVTYSVMLRANLLATGRYVSVLPRSTLNLYGQRMSLKVLPVKLAVRKWPVGIVTLKNRTLNPVAQIFIDHLRAAANMLDPNAPNR
jgi:DNA-binding transcriptional LysR family regulator